MTKNGNNRHFPIHNASACVFKWGWNTLRLYNGKSSSCHRVTPVQITAETFASFHNTNEVMQDRALMVQGHWPAAGRGCEYCRNVEQSGGVSDRLYHNAIAGLTPVDFDGLNPVTPTISEVSLNNTCDLACVYCLPHFSSKVNQELRKFGPYPLGIKSVEQTPDREQLFLLYVDWLKQHGHKLTRLSILGGEPLLQKELWTLLDVLPQIDNQNLELAVNTNLNCNSDTMQKFVAKCKELALGRHIKKLCVSASLDCWGPQAEFVRHGLDLDRWQHNFEFLMQHKWITLSVHQVLTSLTIKTAIDLQNLIAEYKKTNPKILQEYYLVDSGFEKIYHPEIFGGEFFRSQLQRLTQQFPISTPWDQHTKSRLDGIVRMLDCSSADVDRLQMLKQTLNMVDQRRGTDWKKLWPEIDQYFNEKNIQCGTVV